MALREITCANRVHGERDAKDMYVAAVVITGALRAHFSSGKRKLGRTRNENKE